MKYSEKELINYIQQHCHSADHNLVQGIGDDCAVFKLTPGKLGLVTTDTLIEGVHFDPLWHPPELLGRKTASVNLSDIAAMGATPRFALLSLALTDEVACEWIDCFMEGFLAVLKEHDVSLIGGDTVRSRGHSMFSVTVTGEAAGDQILYRSGARKGDCVFVSGWLGEAAAGLELCRKNIQPKKESWQQLIEAHLNPVPLVGLGLVLAQSGLVSAMMDISDGLATDLAHLCLSSGVGAEIRQADIPISAAVHEAAGFVNQTALTLAIKGGEDYQLLFTAAASNSEQLVKTVHERTSRVIYPIGEIIAGNGVFLCRDFHREEISFQGYDHFEAPL